MAWKLWNAYSFQKLFWNYKASVNGRPLVQLQRINAQLLRKFWFISFFLCCSNVFITAAYWVTNPNNILRHNHAAGGTHFGFWYRMHEHPDGPSFTTSVCPRKVELGEFFNNTVHSQGWFGIWIFQDYMPMEGGRWIFLILPFALV